MIFMKYVMAMLLASMYTAVVTAQTLPFSFGNATGDIFTGPNDDGASRTIPLPISMKFLGKRSTSVAQNTNGFLTLLMSRAQVGGLVHVYNLKMDTRNGGVNQNELWLRAGTNTVDLTLARDIIAGTGTAFSPQAIVVATWNKVEAFDRRAGLQNTFQVALAYSETTGITWAIFAYSQLEYFQAAGNSSAANVFFQDAINRQRQVAFVNSTVSMSDLLTGTNCHRPGIYAFPVFSVVTRAPTRAPTPAPTKVPTRSPTKAPTNAPRTPTRAPIPKSPDGRACICPPLIQIRNGCFVFFLQIGCF